MPDLDNTKPVDFTSAEYRPLFDRLQGNILKGHGRDFTVNLFFQFTCDARGIRDTLRILTQRFVGSAYEQLVDTAEHNALMQMVQANAFEGDRRSVAGRLFGNLFLTRRTYDKLGFSPAMLSRWFGDPAPKDADRTFPQHARFLEGMKAAAADLEDHLTKRKASEALEHAYLDGTIDAMLLLAHNDERLLHEAADAARALLVRAGAARIVAEEAGKAKRNGKGEAIEHFQFADGRSQPLFLAVDFEGLMETGHIDPERTRERFKTTTAAIDQWNPFSSLSRVLLPDGPADDPNAFGSYYVFRKLEQNVRAFRRREKALADTLGLSGADRDRAGAMAVGRFRDGTPLAMNREAGFEPARANNFRYDGLDAALEVRAGMTHDHFGLKCPFQAHIRKTNPRQSLDAMDASLEARRRVENESRRHRIVRRGITYGTSPDEPIGEEDIARLPEAGVGLLFACFQSSIIDQFAFIQKKWANTLDFKVIEAQLDPVIGPGRSGEVHHWRKEYGGDYPGNPPARLGQVDLSRSHETEFEFESFVKFRGGEFFFAPSLPFLLGK